MRYANIFQSEYSLIFALYLEKNRFWRKGITLSPKDISSTTLETFCMNFDPKVVVVNSEISSRVTQHAGTRFNRYGVKFQGKKEAYVLKFFFVNIPPSETVSWIFFYNTQFSTFFISLVEVINELQYSAGNESTFIWSRNSESFVCLMKTVQWAIQTDKTFKLSVLSGWDSETSTCLIFFEVNHFLAPSQMAPNCALRGKNRSIVKIDNVMNRLQTF